MFPYETPKGIEHWTLWSKRALSHAGVTAVVHQWCREHERGKHLVRWSWEENARQSFDIPHVHVFFDFSDTAAKAPARRRRWDVT